MSIRTAEAHWEGTLREGVGTVRTGKGGITGNYSFRSRFEEGEGTNPEELVGAAHAGCYSMFLAKLLTDAGCAPRKLETTASVQLDSTDAGPRVTRIGLETRGDVPGMDAADFAKWAEEAKQNCPISHLLAAGTEITLTATLAPQ
ncbi:peroxiredoxin [Pilimelia terevasa]|uniref:Peroxiredoxin n=1 Tax=Pilimelia terevasa TaxID=53372 RepID=A0A8J3BR85_9ACTN|nr:OsmC family peroxiredoxin [Pilimelia terevasa]GGK32988.1 peroxiredoxin [Pilimelia terevasa]